MIRTGFPAYEGHGPELDATHSTIKCVARVVITTLKGQVYVIPTQTGSLVLSAAPAYAALELWELLAEQINTGKTANDEADGKSTWSVDKPTSAEFNGWADEALRKWQG